MTHDINFFNLIRVTFKCCLKIWYISANFNIRFRPVTDQIHLLIEYKHIKDNDASTFIEINERCMLECVEESWDSWWAAACALHSGFKHWALERADHMSTPAASQSTSNCCWSLTYTCWQLTHTLNEDGSSASVTFTFVHLAGTFIQRDSCSSIALYQYVHSLGIKPRTMTLGF